MVAQGQTCLSAIKSSVGCPDPDPPKTIRITGGHRMTWDGCHLGQSHQCGQILMISLG